MSDTRIPLVELAELLHIGTLDAARRGERGESYEGHLLSVSLCPHAWRRIAPLGGEPLVRLVPEAGFARMVDVLRALRTPPLRDQVRRWGLAEGLLESTRLWRAWSTDEEGEWCYGLHRSEDAAREEVYDPDDPSPRGRGCVQPVRVMTGTPALGAWVGMRDLGVTDALEYAMLAYVQSGHPEIDGAWWDERYDPAAFSAPRGGIFPDRIDRFEAVPLGWRDAPEDIESIRARPRQRAQAKGPSF